MRTRSFADMKCSIAGALEHVGDRWSLLIIRDLMFGLSRFDELQASSGIPPQTLADRLRRLQAAKVIVKHQAPSAKGYELTEMGRDLLTVLTALREFGDRWQLHGTIGAPLAAAISAMVAELSANSTVRAPSRIACALCSSRRPISGPIHRQ